MCKSGEFLERVGHTYATIVSIYHGSINIHTYIHICIHAYVPITTLSVEVLEEPYSVSWSATPTSLHNK